MDAADPLNACRELSNGDRLNGCIILVRADTGTCTLKHRIMNLMRVKDVRGMVLMMEDGAVGAGFNRELHVEGIVLPSIEISRAEGLKLLEAVQKSQVPLLVQMTTPGKFVTPDTGLNHRNFQVAVCEIIEKHAFSPKFVNLSDVNSPTKMSRMIWLTKSDGFHQIEIHGWNKREVLLD